MFISIVLLLNIALVYCGELTSCLKEKVRALSSIDATIPLQVLSNFAIRVVNDVDVKQPSLVFTSDNENDLENFAARVSVNIQGNLLEINVAEEKGKLYPNLYCNGLPRAGLFVDIYFC